MKCEVHRPPRVGCTIVMADRRARDKMICRRADWWLAERGSFHCQKSPARRASRFENSRTLFERVKPVGVAGELNLSGARGFESFNRQRRGEGEFAHRAVREKSSPKPSSVITADGKRVELESAGIVAWQCRQEHMAAMSKIGPLVKMSPLMAAVLARCESRI